ncbi:MAG: hypothetical protein JXA04_02740 [Gammaproteobacteria bacterium]|nr:hypothetical protein [Gammaproteobacteria bacterium]
MKVHTTIDSRLQAAANQAIRKGLLDYSERHGYRGPIRVTTLKENIKRIQLDVDQSEQAELQIQTGMADAPEAAEKPVEIAVPQDPAEIHHIPQSEIDELLTVTGRFGDIRPAFVLEIFERKPPAEEKKPEGKEEYSTDEIARVYLGDGQFGELNFQGVKWAKGYISANEQGSELKSMRDVLELGDLIWLRPMAIESKPENNPEQTDTQTDTLPTVWQLTQLPAVEGALVSLDPQTGATMSLVGGFDYYKSKFNRAVQARRQPGSGFKPFVYSAALEDGYTAASIINDAPVVFDDPALEGKWRPENYSGKFFGPTRLREGIVKSRNLVSIRLLIALGIRSARNYAKRFGFDDDALPRDLSLALGSGTLSPLQLVSGFSVFANEGYRIKPFFIDRIDSDEGKVLWYADYDLACLQCYVDGVDATDLEQNYIVEWPVLDSEIEEDAGEQPVIESNIPAPVVEEQTAVTEEPTESVEVNGDEIINGSLELNADTGLELPPAKRVLRQAPRIMDARANYIMNSILRDVVLLGTGRRAMALGRNDIGGKTGTSNDEHDAWFNGFNHKYATTVWVGFDTDQPLGAGEAGSRAALPLWIDYMQVALQGVPEKLPEQPEGLVTIRIDSQTGLLATTETKESVFEIFRTENMPTEKSEPTGDIPFEVEGEENSTTDDSDRVGNSVAEDLF